MAENFHVINFGCRAEQADGAAIERALEARGLARSTSSDASLVVLNTCTVTAAADADARATIRRIHRQNPDCKILVTGCYAQRAPQEIAGLEGVSWVVGNSHKHQIAALVAPKGDRDSLGVEDSSRASAHFPILVGDIFAHTELLAAPVFNAGGERTRPNLKVQDGCNNRCSFCVIPSVRGRNRSLAMQEVLREVRELVALGYREVVISGINLGRWGRDLQPQQRFADLVRAIVEQTELEKLRISSVEPMDWSEELIELVTTHPRIARHAHVPLQSGSDRILRAMHRKYRPWHYAQRLAKIRAASAEAAIGADVMVGFPGETEEFFKESRGFIASLPFTYLHVFTFSVRPGTPAASLPGQIPVEVARERSRVLRELAAEKNLAFRRSFVGSDLNAITLSSGDSEATEALTDNYLKLRLAAKHAPNQWLRAKIDAATSDGLRGTATS